MQCSYCGSEKIHAKGFCPNCYARYLKNGKPDRIKVIKIQECSFCKKISKICAHGLCAACYKRKRKNGTPERIKIKKIQPCSFCKKVVVIRAKGFCSACYDRYKHHGSPEYERKRHICSIDGCNSYVVSHGLCSKHAMRERRLSGNQNNKLNRPLYNIWSGMIRRCYDKNTNNYERYGGNGIDVCDRWKNSFEDFEKDMGERPSKLHSIDRIDGTKGYYPENCRWATPTIQRRNTTNIKLNEQDVSIIRNMAREGISSLKISEIFNCSNSAIRCVIFGETWADIPGALTKEEYSISKKKDK